MTTTHMTAITYERIIQLLQTRKIVGESLHTRPSAPEPIRSDSLYRVEICGEMFTIDRGDYSSQLTFNEREAATATFGGDCLLLDDAQGFLYAIHFEPV